MKLPWTRRKEKPTPAISATTNDSAGWSKAPFVWHAAPLDSPPKPKVCKVRVAKRVALFLAVAVMATVVVNLAAYLLALAIGEIATAVIAIAAVVAYWVFVVYDIERMEGRG